MKIATTTGEMYPFTNSEAEAVRAYEGTGFRYLDYSFYEVLRNPHHPFLSDNWKEGVLEAKKAAENLGFPLISMYDLFTDYCNSNNVPLDSLLADGLHPNDRGYDVMYDLILKELQLN